MANKTNEAIIQQAFADFGKGNVDGILNVLTDDVKWGSYDNPGIPIGGMFNGKEGVRKFFGNLAQNINYSAFDPKEFISDGDNVVVLGHHSGTVKSTGKGYDHDWCMIFKFKGDKVKSYFAFVDTREQAESFK